MRKRNGIWKIAALVVALAIALPLAAMAELVDPTPPTAPEANTPDVAAGEARLVGRVDKLEFEFMGFRLGTGNGMTEAQKSAYQEAMNAYLATEDEQLANLAAAGVLTQGEVDAYKTWRASRQVLSELDTAGWTDEQLTALKEALAKPEEERRQALSALADSLQLTQAQAAALETLAGERTSVWQQIANQTDDATLDALDAMQHAKLSLTQALERAGLGGRRGGIDFGVNEKLKRGMAGAAPDFDIDVDARDAKLKRAMGDEANAKRKGGVGKGF